MNKNKKSNKQAKISNIKAIEILDSRGNPTIQTTVWSGLVCATASVPSGASTGVHEAMELRDGEMKRYNGLGVKKACLNVNGKILKVLRGVNCFDQKKVDEIMLRLDGTSNKSKLGANAILSVSLACMRLSSVLKEEPLYQTIANYYGYQPKNLPAPLFNVINGGVHADSGLDIQEYFLIPQKGKFSSRLRQSAEVYHALKKLLVSQKLSVGVGDEGGFAPHLKNNEAGFTTLHKAIELAGYKNNSDFRLGIDAAASEFFDPDKQVYQLKASRLNFKPASIYKMYQKWVDEFGLQIIEDGCAEDDYLGWQLLTENLSTKALMSKKVSLVGDDLFVTNTARIQKGIINNIANAVLIKPNQIGTLTETLAAIKLAQEHGYKIVISHRSGETADSFISDLAVGVNADFMKAGAPARGERLAKYNRLLQIEQIL